MRKSEVMYENKTVSNIQKRSNIQMTTLSENHAY